MAKVFVISCRDVGTDCEFAAKAGSVEDVIELCADHAREIHGMKGFDRAVYAKMRACIHIVESEPSH